MLILRDLIDFFWQRRSESSSVCLRKDGLMSPVIPFEVQEEAIQDPIGGNFVRLRNGTSRFVLCE
jgi:hypothetical protein